MEEGTSSSCLLFVIFNDFQHSTPGQFEKKSAPAFRTAVVKAAPKESFQGSDNNDVRAILGSFNILLALSQDVETARLQMMRESTVKEATYRRNLDALIADVFEFQYELDEFGEFHVGREEHLFLKENDVSTCEIHADTIVTSGPIPARKIFDELCATMKDNPPPTTSDPTRVEPARADPFPLLRDSDPWDLNENLYFDHTVQFFDVSLRLLLMGVENKNPSKDARGHLFMALSTGQRQRRALCLKDRTLFGITLSRGGVDVFVSFWHEQDIKVSAMPVYTFSWTDNRPLQTVKLFLFLRRLAGQLSKELEEDKEHIGGQTRQIAESLARHLNVWRTQVRPPQVPSHNGKRHLDEPPDDPRPPKQPRTDAHGARTDGAGSLTTENVSKFNQCHGSAQCDIKLWAASTTS
ncbi:hypothetical protein BDZ89DRAFT_251613 [Hymenopellis radicata]|nr:hypothetical protein BDZ89DRAFT_251613 [Hymenopellis radicata]